MSARFSVILPVRNGMPYVKDCVESIRSQRYPDWELRVLDNESRDGTVEWITGLNDPRIHVSRSPRSLTIEESWGRIKDEPKREFMTMIGHDDLFDPLFLALIHDLIETDPGAALYQTGSRLIDARGATIRSSKVVPRRETAAEYLEARLTFQRDVFGTGYVMRSAAYDRLGGIPAFERLFFADDTLWMRLMRSSWKRSDPTEAFSVRLHPQSESASVPRLWPSFVRGLEQFSGFLATFVKEDEASRAVFERLGERFFVQYFRNVYIFALIEASQRGARVETTTVERIAGALDRAAPGARGQLTGSVKVRALEFLNASPIRRIVDPLWGLYQRLKT